MEKLTVNFMNQIDHGKDPPLNIKNFIDILYKLEPNYRIWLQGNQIKNGKEISFYIGVDERSIQVDYLNKRIFLNFNT